MLSAFMVESLGPREGDGRLLLCVLAAVEAGSFLDKPLIRCGRGRWTIFGWTGGRVESRTVLKVCTEHECGRHGPQLSWASWKREAHRPVEGRFGELATACGSRVNPLS